MTISRSANGSIGIQTGETGFVPVVVPPPPPSNPSYFAFGLDNGTDPKLYGSVDLATFAACGALPAGTTRVVYGNGTLVAVANSISNSGNKGLFYSTNSGTTWQEAAYQGDNFANSGTGLDFINGKFLYFIVNNGLTTTNISTSSDGINWTKSGSINAVSPTYVKFFYFKDSFCAISDGDNGTDIYNYFYQMTGDNIWTATRIAPAGSYVYVNAFDEGIAVSDSYIILLTSDNKAWSSPDGTTWTQLVINAVAVYHIGSNFWVVMANGDSIAYDDTTLVQGVTVAGFLSGYKQIKEIDSKVFALKATEEYRIYQSPIPLATPNWTTNSTGIPTTMQLKQLLE